MANQFLIKETMVAMRGLSAAEITALQNGTYNGVQLLGYYEKGDTPAPVIYYISSTSAMDDGVSTIVINGLAFTHQFSGAIDVRYFGCKSDGIQDGSIFLQRAIDYVASFNWLGAVPLPLMSEIKKIQKLHHIFNSKNGHALETLVEKFGGQEKAFEAVEEAANKALKDGKLTVFPNGILPSSDNGNIINVGGMNVRSIGGRFINGNQIEISSFRRKDLK